MDQIRQAIERAKATGAGATRMPAAPTSSHAASLEPAVPASTSHASVPATGNPLGIHGLQIERAHIEARRIVAHHAGGPRSKAFDMLRTQTLQGMDQNQWQFLGITSPTPECGKTLTAVNLAFSIARQPERSVLLLDLDLHRPQVAQSLGMRPKHGVVSVLDGQTKLNDALVEAQIGNLKMLVLPAETRVVDTTELIGSRAMNRLLQEIKRSFPRHTIVMDLPPLLSTDDVIALLPLIDCVLLVAAVGTSTISEIKECGKHLQSSTVLRIVLNKASESANGYYAGVAY